MPNMDSIQFKTKELQIKMYLSQIHRLRLTRVKKLSTQSFLLRVFLTPFTHGEDLSSHMGGTSAGGQSVNGGTHEGGHRPYGGDLTLTDYIIN